MIDNIKNNCYPNTAYPINYSFTGDDGWLYWGSIYSDTKEVQYRSPYYDAKTYKRYKNGNTWLDWATYISDSDIMAETVSLQFSAGACIVNGGINANNCISMTATQKYNEIAKNVTLTAQLTSSGYAIYARNANDGSVYNGKLDLYIIARK